MIELGTIEDMSKAELEQLYSLLISTIVLLARVLGKPCPVATRQERRSDRLSLR
jgi:hypothetical protein